MDIELPFTHDPLLATGERRRAAVALAVALTAGAFTQALFWRTGVGLNFWIWDLAVVAASVVVFRRGRIRPTAWGAIAAAVSLGFSIVRYASDWALAVAVPANVAILAVLPILLRDGLTLSELAHVPARLFASFARAPRAIGDAARVPGKAVGGRGRKLLRGVTLGLLFGAPTAGVFTLLLSSDADFTRALVRAKDEVGDAALFVMWSAITSAGYLVTHALHASAREVESLFHPRASIEGPYRTVDDDVTVPAASGRISVITWATIVGQVALVFAVFVAANLRHLFGGHAVVRAAGNVTYASYLHAGFAQLLVATILSVCLVLTGHALLRPRGAIDGEGPVPGGTLLASIEAALLVLTGITVASCWQRLRIYEDAYGASHLRLGVAFVELMVLGVLVITLVKVVRRRWTGHGGVLLAFVAALAVLASGMNADAYVATTNLDRAARGRPLDVDYLESLSVDARAVLAHPVVAGDHALAARLAARYCARDATDLRAFRGLGACADVAP